MHSNVDVHQSIHIRVFFFALSLQLLADVLDYREPFSEITYFEYVFGGTTNIKGIVFVLFSIMLWAEAALSVFIYGGEIVFCVEWKEWI